MVVLILMVLLFFKILAMWLVWFSRLQLLIVLSWYKRGTGRGSNGRFRRGLTFSVKPQLGMGNEMRLEMSRRWDASGRTVLWFM